MDAGRDAAEADAPWASEDAVARPDVPAATGSGGTGGTGGIVGHGGATATGLGGIVGHGGASDAGLGGIVGRGGATDAGGLGGSVAMGGAGGAGGRGGNDVADAEVEAGGRVGTGGAGGSSSPPAIDANCGLSSVPATRQPADVLLVLDRSGSMAYSISEECSCDSTSGTALCSDVSTCTTRWSSLASAVHAILSDGQGIQWGLKIFSTPAGGSSCAVSSGVEVAVAPSSASVIEAQIDSVIPGNNTPTAAAIRAGTAYLDTVADGNHKAIVLATDGEPNCRPGGESGTADVPGTVDALAAARDAGYLVYVIGIGPSVGNLDNFAQAGGTASFYPATSPTALTEALAAISATVTTCTFTLPTPPPDPNNIAVYLDKSLVARDAGNGWSFGADLRTVVLNGVSCAKAQPNAAAVVQALFGCAGGGMSFPPLLP